MALPIRTVTVAVDFSAGSGQAVDLAGRLARACGAELRLVHAEQLDVPPYFTADQMATLDRERAAARAQAHHYLNTFGRRYTAVPFTTVIDDRPPVDAVLQAQRSTDLLVMGTHGRRGPGRWWMGSVAEHVVRAAAGPTLVVHGSSDIGPESPVLFAGPGADTGAAAKYARMLAGTLAVPLVAADDLPVEQAVKRHRPWLVVVGLDAADPAWPGTHERLVRTCQIPVLFVPPGDAADAPPHG